MKKLLMIITASVLLSSASFASTVTQESHKSFSTATYQSKAEAYDAGFKMVENFNTMTNQELYKTFSLNGERFVSDININGTKVTVDEFATSPGEINYKANVDVDYDYNTYEHE
jgi:opacity protein-like surface antigen